MSLNRLKGFSIVELMISIALGSIIIATVGGIYLSHRTTNNIEIGLARLQENARYANYLLSRELRMAGFLGCSNQNHVDVTNLVSGGPNMADYDIPIKGYDGLSGSFSPSLPTQLSGKPLAGTDVIEIRKASSLGVNLKMDMNLKNNPVLVDDRLGIQAGDIIMITDCMVGDIFKAGSNTNATAITHTVANNISNDLSIAYLSNAQIMRFEYYAFYIKNSGRTNAQGEAIPSLFQMDLNGNEIEIAEGVEQMQVMYGVDTNGDFSADSYQTATQVEAGNNWSNVISMDVHLRFVTPENVNNKAQPYTFMGVTTTPADRKLRREWDTFVTLRNRGISG